jgi:hypothetical protein
MGFRGRWNRPRLFRRPRNLRASLLHACELLYSLTWGYLWKDYLSKGYLWEGYSRSEHLAAARPGEPRSLLAFCYGIVGLLVWLVGGI